MCRKSRQDRRRTWSNAANPFRKEPMTPRSLDDDLALLESGLDAASTPALESLASSLAARLRAVPVTEEPTVRERAVGGLLLAGTQLYRTGDVAGSGEL